MNAVEFPFADVAAALKTQANEHADAANDIELTALQVGLSQGATLRCKSQAQRRADLLAYAHHVFVALLPVEHTIKAIIAAGEGWK